MKQLFLVATGGSLGAVLRWLLASVVTTHTPNWRFPLGTFLVNLLGCLVAGILAGLVVKLDAFSADTRLFLFTGILGGFTTFSAFGVDTVSLIRKQEFGIAFAYVAASVLCGIGILWLMFILVGKSSN